MLEIYLKDLIVEGHHGVTEAEKKVAQRFCFNLTIKLNDEQATGSDDLKDTLNYAELRNIITQVTQQKSFNLLEKLAHTIASSVMKDKRIKELIISVEKLDIFDNAVPGVRLTCYNNDNRHLSSVG